MHAWGVRCFTCLRAIVFGAQVAVAHGIYDFVDKRIQELDSQLVEFDKELAAEREHLGVEPVRAATLAAGLMFDQHAGACCAT